MKTRRFTRKTRRLGKTRRRKGGGVLRFFQKDLYDFAKDPTGFNRAGRRRDLETLEIMLPKPQWMTFKNNLVYLATTPLYTTAAGNPQSAFSKLKQEATIRGVFPKSKSD